MASQLSDGLDSDDQSGERQIFSDSENKKNSETLSRIMLLIVTKISVYNSGEISIEPFCNPYNKNNDTKILKHKKMILTIHKSEKIHTNLWASDDPLSLLEKSFIGVLLNKYTCKS